MKAEEAESSSRTTRVFLRFIATAERVGNVLPHPFTVFVILLLVVIALSAIVKASV